MKMKEFLLIGVFFLWSLIGRAQISTADAEMKQNIGNPVATLSAEDEQQEAAVNPKHFYKYWKEKDDEYLRTVGFQKQIARTQIAGGSILLAGGMAMIGYGSTLLNANEGLNAAEIRDYQTKNKTRAGRTLLATGAFSGVAGIFLLFKGSDSLVMLKNQEGKVVGKIGLPDNGDAGVKIEF
ncbi:MAG: hypothetical protein KatS3mg031_1487 [Chitinophagales bacterium]|nr:MAG: hypothetical protein KatS3mg031_1487 [Chitinophagales bacterium]